MSLRFYLTVFVLILVAGCSSSGGDSAMRSVSTETPTADPLTVHELLERARAALFDGSDVLHITVSALNGPTGLEYVEAWVDPRGDAVRLQHPEPPADDPRHSWELLVNGQRHFGLWDQTYSEDPLALLFRTDTKALESAGNVNVTRTALKGEQAIVVRRSLPPGLDECPRDVRLYLDDRTYLPMRVEEEYHSCIPGDASTLVAADFRYDTVKRPALPSGFFDPSVLRAEHLRESLMRFRSTGVTPYWLGEDDLIGIKPIYTTPPIAGPAFYYGEPGGLTIAEYKKSDELPIQCRAAAETIQTVSGPAEYCAYSLTLTMRDTVIQIIPDPTSVSKDHLATIVNRLRPVE